MYWHGGKKFERARRMSGLFCSEALFAGATSARPFDSLTARPPTRIKDFLLRHSNDNGFAERRTAAAEAKRQLLAKFASAPKATDPEMQERLAARETVAVARQTRRAEREALKQAEAAAAIAAAEALEREEAEARQAEIANHASRALAAEAARKAERDRRYAARKARRA
jgi:hypothetical protein